MNGLSKRAILLHAGAVLLLFLLQFVASDYVALSLTRVMLLAIFAMGYNLLFGYVGLLSLGHAMFFAAGLYVAAIGTTRLGWSVPLAFAASIVIGAAFALAAGAIALRARGVAFMIVTLMFSQAAFLTVLYFGAYTRGDEGIVIPDAVRQFMLAGFFIDLADAATRYNAALLLFALATALCLFIVKSPVGHVLVAIRENEARTEMLGFNVWRYKLFAVAVSGTLSAMAGSAYALMFAFAGSTLASIQYSIHPLLWTLLGGPATILGPLIGTAVMFSLTNLVSSYTNANLLAVGVVLILLVLFFPKGLLGTVRERWLPWLP
jgi:branched-chain amino acid transport system permease protein